MNTITHCSAGAREGATGPVFVSRGRETDPAVINAARLAKLERAATFPPLDTETRAAVETACAAYHLNRKSQTLRCWAVYESGPIRAFRVHGRLMWPTARLRELCGVAQ